MPGTSAKNYALSPAGADLGLTGGDPQDEETEDEKKKRLAQIAAQQKNDPAGLAVGMLGLGMGGAVGRVMGGQTGRYW